MIKSAVTDWISRECPEESVREWDESGAAPQRLAEKFLSLGFAGLSVPEKYEGEGADYLGCVLVTEELAARYPALARAFGSTAFYGGLAFTELGSEKQKKKLLPEFSEGKRSAAILFCGADSREDSGEQPPLPAISEGGSGISVSGSGWLVGSAGQGDKILFTASAGTDADARVDVCCLEPGRAGLCLEPHKTLGYKGNTISRLTIQDIKISEQDMLGRGKKDAWRILLGLLHLELGAEALGIGKGSLNHAVSYARQRVQFGRPIARFPAVRDMIVHNDCCIQSAAMLLYRAASAADAGKPWTGDAARGYYAACRAARRTSLDALQILGGYGYTMEFPAQRYVRDAVSLYNTGAESEALKSLLAEKTGLQAA